MFKGIRSVAGLGAVLAAGVVAMGAHAFTASNTVPDTKAGIGAGAISGYVVTDVAYTFSADGTNITGVDFNLDGLADTLKIKLFGADSWHSCTPGTTAVTGKYAATCTGFTIANASATELSVLAQKA